MLRLYDPTKGTISVNGKGIKSLELVELRESMAAPFRDYTQFPSTALKSEMSFHGLVADKKSFGAQQVKDNIALGDPQNAYGESRARKAARLENENQHVCA